MHRLSALALVGLLVAFPGCDNSSSPTDPTKPSDPPT